MILFFMEVVIFPLKPIVGVLYVLQTVQINAHKSRDTSFCYHFAVPFIIFSSWLRVQVYSELFNDATPERLERVFKYLDKDESGFVDFLSWSRGLRLHDVPQVPPKLSTSLTLVARHCRSCRFCS